MKAIVVHQFGGPEALKYEDVPTPQPAAGQVLVRVHAAGVNPYDTYMRSGTYAIKPPLPYTPGSDAAGEVEAVGQGVTKFKRGDRVYTAKTVTGAYAEYALTLESQVHRLPEKVSYSQGAGVWVPYGTAYHALYQCAIAHAGESVLIHGASGGVGTAAVQIARALGMTVLGTAGTDKGLDLVRREGAHHVFNHSQSGYLEKIMEATGGRGVDVVLEMLANVNLGHDLKLLAPQGRVIVIGSRGDVTITPRDLMARRTSVRAFTLWGISEAEDREIHAGLFAGLDNGTLRPVVGKEWPLRDAARAHQQVLEPGAFGKIVLVP
ncbi:MAG TPA: NADPH:quinone reductase [Candidatus Acidoferrales bacterium]|nr:NADPH:quinone reductase [Candidatus Acidoferrales bacterium]